MVEIRDVPLQGSIFLVELRRYLLSILNAHHMSYWQMMDRYGDRPHDPHAFRRPEKGGGATTARLPHSVNELVDALEGHFDLKLPS